VIKKEKERGKEKKINTDNKKERERGTQKERQGKKLEKERDTQKERQGKKLEKERDIQKERQTHRKTERDKKNVCTCVPHLLFGSLEFLWSLGSLAFCSSS
jgi:hypothetical protein